MPFISLEVLAMMNLDENTQQQNPVTAMLLDHGILHKSDHRNMHEQESISISGGKQVRNRGNTRDLQFLYYSIW